MRLTTFALAAAPLAATVSAFHIPTVQDAFESAQSLLEDMTPASDITLASVPVDDFFVLQSAHHPNHKVRIKSTDGWCDPDVRSYSGYLDVGGGKDLWFSFFESRGDPATDPVIMWINGGPGCSSALGLLMELGPCSVADDPKTSNDTKVNPYSWNNNANIFFLDEPVNVGFSKARHGQVVGTAEEAGQDIAAFVSIFFDTFKEFQGREFHMAGESYGGRYLPIFASAVYDNNRNLVAAGKEPINLQSVMIGNGVSDLFATTESYFPYQCTVHADLNQTVQSIENCVAMAEAVPKCHRLALRGCLDSRDPTECFIALSYCEETLGSSFLQAGVNPYDVSKKCTLEELADSLCYPETKKIKTYLDLPDTRRRLGIDKHEGPWNSCDNGVFAAFQNSLDSAGKTWLYVAALLERGVRVLNYAGTLDFICNHIGNEVWMEDMQWTGQKQYNAAQLEDWTVDGELAGQFKTHGHLTLLKVYGAGHMVPMDQPKNAASFLKDWLAAGTVGQ